MSFKRGCHKFGSASSQVQKSQSLYPLTAAGFSNPGARVPQLLQGKRSSLDRGTSSNLKARVPGVLQASQHIMIDQTQTLTAVRQLLHNKALL